MTFQHPPPSGEIIVFIYHDLENDRKISEKQTQTFLVWEPSVLLFVPFLPSVLTLGLPTSALEQNWMSDYGLPPSVHLTLTMNTVFYIT